MRCKNQKYHKSLRTILQHVHLYVSWRFSIPCYFKTVHSSSRQTFAVFSPKMAKHDVTKTPFSQKKYRRIFVKFNGRRQINADEGTECFASISAAVFVLLRKSGRGTESVPHDTVGRIGLLARHGAKKKNRFSKRTILCHHWGRKISIPHNWCIDVPKTPLVSAAWLQT